MEKNTKRWIAGSVALGLLALVVAFTNGDTKIIEKVTEQLGAASGPDRSFPCENRNGIEQCFGRQVMRQATTTVCAARSPSATSTLVRGSAIFTTSTSSASIVHMAKALTFNSTTTSLGTFPLLANQQGAFTASTTPSGVAGAGEGGDPLDNDFIFGPNQYFVVGVQQTGAGGMYVVGFAPVGTCNATFEIL